MTRTMMKTVAAVTALLLCAGAVHAGEGYSLRWLPATSADITEESPTGLSAFDEIDPSESDGISTGRAVLYSLLIPGLGDYKAGNKTRAWVFFGIDAALWTTLIVSEVQGHQREDEYQQYALLFAGISQTGHSDDFYALLREYDNSDLYEADIKAEGRVELWPPDNPNGQDPNVGYIRLQQYFEQNRVADYEEWEWQSLANKVQFQETRSASKNAYRRSQYALAALAANRVVSAIFAYASTRGSHGDSSQQSRRYQLDFTLPQPDYEASVTLIRRF